MRAHTIWQRDFLTLWSGSTASGFATWGLTFLMGLAVTTGDIGAVMLGTVLAVRTGGFLAGVLGGGMLADRFTCRGVIFWASLSGALGVAIVAVGLGAAPGLAAGLLLAGAALSGLGQGACRPAYQALVPLVIAPEARQAANAAMGLSVRLVVLLGPALTGALALSIGLAPTFAGLVLVWLVSALAPPRPAGDRPRGGTRPGLWHDLAEGLAESRRHPWFLASLAALTAVIATGYSATNVILPLLSESRYGGPRLLVACMTAYTAGGILGALIVARVRFRLVGWWALTGLGAYALVPLSLLAGGGLAGPLAAYVLAGLGIEIFNTLWFTAIQNQVPQDRLARVSSLDFLVSYGLAPLGLSVIAPLTVAIGIAPVLAGCAAICLIAPALATLVPSSRRYARD